MTEIDIPLLQRLDPEAVRVAVRFQGALIARLAERLGQKAVDAVFTEVARYELPRNAEELRPALTTGQTHFLGTDERRRFGKAALSQMLRTLCRRSDEALYAGAYHQAADDAMEGADHGARLVALKSALDRAGALRPDPNSTLPVPPEHFPLFQADFDLALQSFVKRG